MINLKKSGFILLNYIKLPMNLKMALYDYYYRAESLIKYGDPFFARIICFEINTYCNRRCSYCPVSLETAVPNHFMDEKLFKLCIQRLKEINFTGSIMYHFYNEPLHDKRIADFVKYTSKELPQAISRIFTNGDKLTMEVADELFDAGLNDFLITDHNLKKGILRKKLTKNGVLDKYKSQIFIDEGLGQTDDRPLDNRGGSVDIEALGSKERIRKNCKIVYEEVKVDYLGNVLLCSNDYYREHNFGNLKEKKFMEIWKDTKYSRIRNNLRKAKSELEICQKCNYASPDKI